MKESEVKQRKEKKSEAKKSEAKWTRLGWILWILDFVIWLHTFRSNPYLYHTSTSINEFNIAIMYTAFRGCF